MIHVFNQIVANELNIEFQQNKNRQNRLGRSFAILQILIVREQQRKMRVKQKKKKKMAVKKKKKYLKRRGKNM